MSAGPVDILKQPLRLAGPVSSGILVTVGLKNPRPPRAGRIVSGQVIDGITGKPWTAETTILVGTSDLTANVTCTTTPANVRVTGKVVVEGGSPALTGVRIEPNTGTSIATAADDICCAPPVDTSEIMPSTSPGLNICGILSLEIQDG